MAVSRVGHDKTPQSLATPAFAGFSPIAESSTKAALTTCLTTYRKNFIFTVRRGIMAEIEYPGVVQLIERVVWDHEAESLSLSTRTKIPLKSLISEGFFLFFVYCGAIGENIVRILIEFSVFCCIMKLKMRKGSML